MTEKKPRGGAGNFAMNRERAVAAGRAGGKKSGGNFKNDPARARDAGRKGGTVSGGNFKNDPARAAAAGREGGSISKRPPAIRDAGAKTGA